MTRHLQVVLSPGAQAALAGNPRNRPGESLRDFLVRSFETAAPARMTQVPLFSETIVVEDDVPLMLETVSRVTGRTTDELVEAWALEESSPGDSEAEMALTGGSTALPDDVKNRIIELLDLAETLFEETVSDVEQRFGPYPQGKQAGASAAEIYRALRSLLKITGAK